MDAAKAKIVAWLAVPTIARVRFRFAVKQLVTNAVIAVTLFPSTVGGALNSGVLVAGTLVGTGNDHVTVALEDPFCLPNTVNWLLPELTWEVKNPGKYR